MSARMRRKEYLAALQEYSEDVCRVLDLQGRQKLAKWLRDKFSSNPAASSLMSSYFQDGATAEKAATELLSAIKRDKYTITDW